MAMGVIDNLKRTFSLTDTFIPSWFKGFGGLSSFYLPEASNIYFIDAYASNPYVKDVVSLIADKAAALPRFTYYEDGEKVDISDDFWLNATKSIYINSDGDEVFSTEYKLIYNKLVVSLLTTGNAFLWNSGDRGQMQGILQVWEPQNVTIDTIDGSEGGEIKSYTYCNSSGERNTAPAENVLHIKYPNILEDTNWGLSPLQGFVCAIETSSNAFEAQAALLKNKGIGGILTPKDSSRPTKPEDREQMTEAFKGEAGGAGNFGKVIVSGAAYDYQNLAMNLTDLKALEVNIEMRRVIASIYNVPSQLLGDTSASTYNNVKEAEKALYLNAILPVTKLIDECLSDWIYKFWESDDTRVIKTDTSGIEVLAQDNNLIIDMWQKLLASNVVNINEARQALNGAGVINVDEAIIINDNEEDNA